MSKQCEWKKFVTLYGTKCRYCCQDSNSILSVGTKVEWGNCQGIVIPNIKKSNDTCIAWESSRWSSYDRDFLKEHLDKGSIKIIEY